MSRLPDLCVALLLVPAAIAALEPVIDLIWPRSAASDQERC